jgi:HEAT repeat protein
MSRKDSDVRARIERYQQLCEAGEANLVAEATRKALTDRHYLLVSRAAELCAERLIYDLEASLIQAYGRLLENPVKKDPSCIAKGAIARALLALDSQDSDFYVAGIHYRQLEPVWGGTVDTAVDLRCTCAMGLVGTSYPRALIELVTLLHDPEPHARSGAARAIACTEHLAAEAVLCCKALAGDPEAEVAGECFTGLLKVEPDEAPAFVAGFLDGPDPAIREQAALALGESRLDTALQMLRERWEAQPLKRDKDRVLLRAAALHRSEAAFDWLCSVVANGDKASASLLVQELAVWRVNKRLREWMRTAVERRGDSLLQEDFEQRWSLEKG